MCALPLAGRVAVVTGVSRRAGIGASLVRRLLDDGAHVLASGWAAHDEEMPWGADPEGTRGLVDHLSGPDRRLQFCAADLGDPGAADALIGSAVERFGAVDIVVANHARSSRQALAALTVDELDRSWAVNTRASVLLAKSLAEHREPERPGGRIVLFTSGQHLGPMPDELPYAITKGAIHQMTASLADSLIDRGVTVNCVNPGPVDTGYARGAVHAEVAARFPAGRWGRPDDVARLVSWLVSDEGRWITGQIINSEGGFRRG